MVVPPDHVLVRLLWRVGRTVGRTVYAVVGDEASKDDVLIGLMDSSELASAVVAEHNMALGIHDDA